jgi:hypothetical protein
VIDVISWRRLAAARSGILSPPAAARSSTRPVHQIIPKLICRHAAKAARPSDRTLALEFADRASASTLSGRAPLTETNDA